MERCWTASVRLVHRSRPAGRHSGRSRRRCRGRLSAVLALLDDVQEEAAQTRQAAADRAQEIRGSAHRQAADLSRKPMTMWRGRGLNRKCRRCAKPTPMRRTWSETEAEIARLRQRAGERLAHDVDTVAAEAAADARARLTRNAIGPGVSQDRHKRGWITRHSPDNRNVLSCTYWTG